MPDMCIGCRKRPRARDEKCGGYWLYCQSCMRGEIRRLSNAGYLDPPVPGPDPERCYSAKRERESAIWLQIQASQYRRRAHRPEDND